MLSFYVVNIEYGDGGGNDDDDNLSGFLLDLATSRATLAGLWVLDVRHRWYIPSRQSPTCLPFTNATNQCCKILEFATQPN